MAAFPNLTIMLTRPRRGVPSPEGHEMRLWPCPGALLLDPFEHGVDFRHGTSHFGGVLAAHDDLVAEAAVAERRIGTDRQVRMRLGDFGEPGRIGAFGTPVASIVSISIFAPVSRRGTMSSSIACMIRGTPASTMTFSILKPGALEMEFCTSSAPTGRRAMRRRAALRSSGFSRSSSRAMARGSSITSRPSALATDSEVMSSWVGPMPPVVKR